MSKTKVVVFDKDGGWVLINPDPKEYRSLNYVVNPDLSAVKGIPPEHWALVGNKVVSSLAAAPKVSWYIAIYLKVFKWIVRLLNNLNSI